MVRDLGIEEERQPASTGAARGPPGGRPPVARQRRPDRRTLTAPATGGSGPARPADKPGDGEPPKPKKPRNRKHGRPR